MCSVRWRDLAWLSSVSHFYPFSELPRARRLWKMSPPVKKVTIDKVSIPVHYNIRGTPLFTPNWYREVAKTDFFWGQIKRYISQGTFNRRIGLEIRTDIEETNQTRAQGREDRKANQLRTSSASVARESAATTPRPDEGLDSEPESGLTQAQEIDETTPTRSEYHLRLRERPAQKPSSPVVVEKVECPECNDFAVLSEMSLNEKLDLVCKSCAVGEVDPAFDTITISVPMGPIEPPRQREESDASRAIQLEAPVIKVEKEENRDPHYGAATASISANAKRPREEGGQVMDISGERFIIYTDKNGKEHAILHPSQPGKKIKIELEA